MSFWDIVWFIVIFFAFMAYLMVLFMILGDLMSDSETSGLAKGLWVVFLVILPLIASLIYLIARGSGMSRRRMAEVKTVMPQAHGDRPHKRADYQPDPDTPKALRKGHWWT